MAGIDNSLLPSIADSGAAAGGYGFSQYSALFSQFSGGMQSAFGSYYQALGQQTQNGSLKSQLVGQKAQLIGQKAQLIGQKYQLAGQKTQLAASRIGLDYQAHMAALNATLAELSAQDALDQGKRQVQQVQLATGQMVGTQRASMAARGIDLGSETSVNVQASTKLMGEVDANTLQANAIRQAWGLRIQAANHLNESLMAKAGADSAGLMGDAINPDVINPDVINPDSINPKLADLVGKGASPGLAMAGSLLSTAGSVASGWYNYAGKK